MSRAPRNGTRLEFSLRRRLLAPQTIVSLAVTVALATFIVARFDIAWSETWRVVRQADPGWYALAILVHYTTFIFRGGRWRVLLENAARGDAPSGRTGREPTLLGCGGLLLMAWFANSVTWFRMGDAYRAYAYAEDTGTSFSRAAGTVLTDRLVDVAVVVALMVVAMALLYAAGDVRPPLAFVFVGTGLLAVISCGLAAMFVLRDWLPRRLPGRVRTVYQRFHAGTMGSFGRMPLVLVLGVLGWLSEVGRLFCVLKALGVVVAPGLVVFVPLANGLLSAVPLTPGGLGIVEAGVSGLLQLELTVELAFAVALADRVISYVSILITGGIVFTVRQVRMGNRGRSTAAVA